MTRSYLKPNPRLDKALADRSHKRPVCKRIYPKYGNHCQLHAIPGTDFCEKHQPERRKP